MSMPVDSLIDSIYSLLLVSIVLASSPWIWFRMVVENLGLSFALNWIYDTFSSSQSHKAVEADVCSSRDQREKYNNFAASPSKDDRSIGADDDVAGELSMTS